MITVGTLLVMLAMAVGLFFKFYSHLLPVTRYHKVTWFEFGVGSVASAVIVTLLLIGGGKLAVKNRATFQEFWNGQEISASVDTINCTRDGPCRWEYSCDPYVVCVPVTSCNGKTCTTSVQCHTEYHDCPYCDTEYTYTVLTTLGEYTIRSHGLPDNPNARRWRAGHAVPGNVIASAGTGVPQFWTQARDRVASGRGGPVTTHRAYQNYILASDQTILASFSEDTANLPSPSFGITEPYIGNKVYTVGLPLRQGWAASVNYFNILLGRLEGDLHVVLAHEDSIGRDPDRFTQAMRAYWSNAERWGRQALPKNALVLVIITPDERAVSEIRAFTGMPSGNELLLTRLNRLKGMPFSPAIFGQAGSVDGRTAVSDVEQTILYDATTRFRRVSMAENYLYLRDEIKPKTWQIVLIGFLALLLCTGVWVGLLNVNIDPTEVQDAESYGMGHRGYRHTRSGFRRH